MPGKYMTVNTVTQSNGGKYLQAISSSESFATCLANT
jgi:hypothetical protein